MSVIQKAHDFCCESVHIVPATDGGMATELCCHRCKLTLPRVQFEVLGRSDDAAQYLGRLKSAFICHPHCFECRQQERDKLTSHELYSSKLDRYWQKATNSLRGGAKSRGILFAIDKNDVLGLYLECGGVCALTGLQTDWREKGHRGRNGRNYKAPSVDRINSRGNYVRGNLQIVMQVVNIMKNDLPDDMFIAMCRQVAEHNLFR